MEKSNLTPDPIRDAPDGHGEGQAPGPVAIMPGRATRDLRFVRYPMTFFILSYCCSHASAYTACFWVNQGTIAKTIGVSQQAVSQHFNKLIEWGYIEKLRKEAPSRPYGKKGAVWRVIYDPRMSWEDVVASTPEPEKTPEEVAREASKTIELADRGPRGHISKSRKRRSEPVDNVEKAQAPACESDSKEDDKYKPQLVQQHKVQLVHNYYNRTTYKEDISEGECRRLCAAYASVVQRSNGRGWQYDLRQMSLARDLMELGYTVETFEKDASGVVHWLRKKNKQPPQSLQYFVTRKHNETKDKAQSRDPMDLVKHTANKLRLS